MKAVIGHYNSGVMIPADRIYNIAHIPVITGAASNPAVTSAGLPYVFRLAANDNVMGARMAEFARKELKEGQYKPPGTANGFLMSGDAFWMRGAASETSVKVGRGGGRAECFERIAAALQAAESCSRLC